ITATADTYAGINGKTGTSLASVLDNDELNGDLLNGTDGDPSDVILTPGTSPHPGIHMNADGTITVMPGTPANTYNYPYTICEVLNPTNCASTTATITVDPTPIDAVDDNPTTTNPLGSIDGYT